MGGAAGGWLAGMAARVGGGAGASARRWQAAAYLPAAVTAAHPEALSTALVPAAASAASLSRGARGLIV